MLRNYYSLSTFVVVIILVLALYVPRRPTPDEVAFKKAMETAHDLLNNAAQSAYLTLQEAVANATILVHDAADNALQSLKKNAQYPGWLIRSPDWTPPKNYTDLFWKLYNETVTRPAVQELGAAHISVLFVGGIFTDYYPRYLVGNLQYLNTIARMISHVSVVGINSVAAVEVNAAVIRDTVLSEARACNYSRKIILIGHSKGGVDVSAALSLYPEIHKLVHSAVLMQTPYAGTLLVSDILAGDFGASVLSFVKMIGWDANAMVDMTYRARIPFIREHPHPQNVPTICLVTEGVPTASFLSSIHAFMEKVYNQSNDGLVTADDAMTNGCALVHLHGVDHAGPVFDNLLGLSPVEPGPLTETLLRLALIVARRWPGPTSPFDGSTALDKPRNDADNER